MELAQIRYFLSVAECLNYTKAAEANHISRQAMRQSLKALELEIGAPLVENSHNHLSLTGLGLSFASALKPLIDDLDRVESEIKTMAKGIKTPIRMGYSPTFFPFIIPNLMTDLHAMANAFPFAEFHFDAEEARDLTAKLCIGELDMALFMSMPPHEFENVSVLPLKRYPLGITARKGSFNHEPTDPNETGISNLAGLELVGVDELELTMRPFADALRDHGIAKHYEYVHDVFTAMKKVELEGKAFIEMWRAGESRAGSNFENLRIRGFDFDLCLGWNNSMDEALAQAIAAYMIRWDISDSKHL